MGARVPLQPWAQGWASGPTARGLWPQMGSPSWGPICTRLLSQSIPFAICKRFSRRRSERACGRVRFCVLGKL